MGDAVQIAPLLHLLGALLTLGLGLLAVLLPDAAARITSLAPEGILGRTEIRATYGGMFVALGTFALLGPDVARIVVGAAWIGIAAGRLLGAFLDGHEPKVYGAVVFEGGVALLLLFPRP
jgi:hypothetical protein